MVAQNEPQSTPHTPNPTPHTPMGGKAEATPIVHSNTGRFDRQEAARIQSERELLGKARISSPGQVVDQALNGKSDTNSDIAEVVGKANVPLVDQARQQSIQLRGQKQEDFISSSISNIFQAADTLPPWWSTQRDRALSDLWHVSDLLAGAMYMMASKMSTVPFHIEARNMSITAHLQDAERYERRLQESSEWGTGWGQFMQKQVESLMGQDNGRFMELIDLSRNKLQRIKGPVISVAHLDPSRCMRTSNPKFPVLYERTDGKRIKLHWTRVAFEAQLPSEKVDMLGVGLCAVSRSAGFARHMLDIAQYKEEKLGSRPMRGIITVGGGLDPEIVGRAFDIAGGLADSKGLKRFNWLPVIGNSDIEEPTIQLTELSSLPDGYNEQEATEIAMAAIALGFGVDARELWPGMQAASTRADALLSHIKQRGKGPGHILQETERMFNNWYLPRYLKMVFDFQDDAQDRQKAEIRRERAATRRTDIDGGTSDDRTERERMVKEGELSTAQFDTLELESGRLPDGTPIEVLFFRDDPIYNELLELPGISDPLDFRANDPESTLDKISQSMSDAFELLANEERQIQKRQIQQSIAALKFIQSEYEELEFIEQQEEALEEQQALQQQSQSSSSSSATPSPPKNSESEEPINKRPDDENNLATVENSPREFKKDTGKEHSDMDIRKALRKVRNRKVTTPEQAILKGLEEMMLDNMPEPVAPVIRVEPIIEINMPEYPKQDVHVHVEKSDTPEIIVQSPKIELNPEIIVEPKIVIEKSDNDSEPAPKYEVVEIIERDAANNIKRVKRERVDE